MKISIITPTYNQADYIEQTLQSVINQGGDFDLEYWVMDGGSTDQTLDLLRKYEQKLRWKSSRDRGQAHALNKGIDLTTGDIIGWINSDDYYDPGAFQKIHRIFLDHPNCQWVIGRCRIIDSKGGEIRKMITRYKNKWLDRYSYDKLLVEDFISQPAVFFRKSFLNEVGPINENLHFTLDYDLWLRMGARVDPIIIPEYLASFRYHAGSKTKSQLENSLLEVKHLCQQYANGRNRILFHSFLYRMKINIVYRLLHLLGR